MKPPTSFPGCLFFPPKAPEKRRSLFWCFWPEEETPWERGCETASDTHYGARRGEERLGQEGETAEKTSEKGEKCVKILQLSVPVPSACGAVIKQYVLGTN